MTGSNYFVESGGILQASGEFIRDWLHSPSCMTNQNAARLLGTHILHTRPNIWKHRTEKNTSERVLVLAELTELLCLIPSDTVTTAALSAAVGQLGPNLLLKVDWLPLSTKWSKQIDSYLYFNTSRLLSRRHDILLASCLKSSHL